jgi:hypothetical protein
MIILYLDFIFFFLIKEFIFKVDSKVRVQLSASPVYHLIWPLDQKSLYDVISHHNTGFMFFLSLARILSQFMNTSMHKQ